MTNEELAELERLLKAPPSPHGRWYDLGGWLSVNADAVLSALREAEALRAENARLREGFTIADEVACDAIRNGYYVGEGAVEKLVAARAALEQGEVK